jgi:hypothetical protein
MAIKNFKDLNDMDFIYMMNPFTLKVDALKIKEIKGLSDPTYRGVIPDPEKKKHWVSIEYYRREEILQVVDLANAHTTTLLLDGNKNFQLTLVKVEGYGDVKMPIPYCTDRKAMEEWQQRTM